MKRILLLAAACLTPLGLGISSARAQTIAFNPGGQEVITNSTTSTFVDVNTPSTQTVSQFSTTIDATLNGGASVFDQTFALQFSDPTVQAAVTEADAILTADKATFGAPVPTSNTTALESSLITDVTGTPVADGNTKVTDTITFGPATIDVGPNQSELFIIAAGQEDINVNTNGEFDVPVSVLTTNTDLTTQDYLINGTATATQGGGGTSSVPDSGSTLILLGVGLAGLGWAARWKPRSA
jgi:hypothetical protein